VQNNGPAANNREIERKFLLKRVPDTLNRSRCYIIDQGYLASEPAGRQVRLRKKGSIASLTFKVGRGSHREEREIRLIYQGKHAGLVVAEVEFPDRVSCRKFKPPSWFGREVTGEKRYSNVRLANE
jgi:CYTH domain-containing protein